MKWASDTKAIAARVGMSKGCAYARSIASRARNMRRLTASCSLLTGYQPPLWASSAPSGTLRESRVSSQPSGSETPRAPDVRPRG